MNKKRKEKGKYNRVPLGLLKLQIFTSPLFMEARTQTCPSYSLCIHTSLDFNVSKPFQKQEDGEMQPAHYRMIRHIEP